MFKEGNVVIHLRTQLSTVVTEGKQYTVTRVDETSSIVWIICDDGVERMGPPYDFKLSYSPEEIDPFFN
jgi:hypothetical protein